MSKLLLDKGFVKKLLREGSLHPIQSKELSGEELELEMENKDLFIDFDKDKKIEISDVNGTFALEFELTKDKLEKLKKFVKGP
jgi:hypothetical protein